jgi:hypothetical protein
MQDPNIARAEAELFENGVGMLAEVRRARHQA